jgi:Uma2 family endonuclease
MTALERTVTMDGMSVMPRDATDWTVEDLDRIPDDGLRYELLDGILLVTPAPIVVHQRAVGNVFSALRALCPPELEAFVAPLDWRPDRRTSLQPDVLVARVADLERTNITAPLVLAVEVLSPSTRRKDAVLKRSKYEDSGVLSYWLVDPDEPAITAYDLIDGQYVEAGRSTRDQPLTLTRPCAITLTPADLISR